MQIYKTSIITFILFPRRSAKPPTPFLRIVIALQELPWWKPTSKGNPKEPSITCKIENMFYYSEALGSAIG